MIINIDYLFSPYTHLDFIVDIRLYFSAVKASNIKVCV